MSDTKYAMRTLLRTFIVVAGLVVGACSNGGSDSPALPEDEFILGGFALPGEHLSVLAGIQVRATDTHGTVVSTGPTGPAGNFALGRESWAGFVGRIEADTAWRTQSGTTLPLRLSRDIDTASEGSAYLLLGPISTLARRYRASHPELGIEAAHAAALAHLGVPTSGAEPGFETHTAFGESHRSPASWTRLLAAVVETTPQPA